MCQRGRDGLGRLQRRDLQLPRARRRPAARGHRFATRVGHRGARPSLRGAWRALRRASGACSPSRSGMHPGGSLLLARDRLGIKPLYYAARPRGWSSAPSSRRSCRARGSRGGSTAGLVAYLQYGYVPDPQHPRGRGQAPARPHPCRSGAARPSGPAPVLARDAVLARSRAAPSARRRRPSALWSALRTRSAPTSSSDVPVGAFLSGGLDSSTVVAIMARGGWRRRSRRSRSGSGRTATTSCPTPARSPSCSAPSITSSSSSRTTSGSSTSFSGFDEPFADSSAIPTYLVSRLARQHVKVVLSATAATSSSPATTGTGWTIGAATWG